MGFMEASDVEVPMYILSYSNESPPLIRGNIYYI